MSNATHSLTVAASVALGTNQSWYVTNGQTLSVPGGVSGSSSLYKDGLGSLYLTGINSFTGSFTNNGGRGLDQQQRGPGHWRQEYL